MKTAQEAAKLTDQSPNPRAQKMLKNIERAVDKAIGQHLFYCNVPKPSYDLSAADDSQVFAEMIKLGYDIELQHDEDASWYAVSWRKAQL